MSDSDRHRSDRPPWAAEAEAAQVKAADAPAASPRRWTALIFICLAQLMVVLDITIVNIALPSAQSDLGFSDGSRQWVVTGYTLAFGSLLLLGGRIADYTGRKRAFLIGLLGFATASAIGGAAPSFGVLLAARALQGVFGALLAPAALSLLAVLFTQPRERAKAFGIFGAIAAGGSAIGLLLGGLLTEYLDWRWCMYVNIPIALVAVLGGYLLLSDSPTGAGARARFDVPGVLLVTGGLVAVVYACSEAESEGWSSALVVGLLVLGGLLLAAFAVVESRVAQPLLPLRVIWDRTRGGAYLAVGLTVIGMMGMLFFLTYYLQIVKDYSPVEAGLAFLPMSAAVVVSAGGIASRLLPRVAPRTLMVPGLLVAALGMAWLTTLEADSSYVAVVLPALLLIGAGMGQVMAPAMNYATHAVGPQDAGIASGSVNTAQQIGGSIGTALLNTVATSATADYLVAHGPGAKDPGVVKAALVDGYTTAFTWAFVILVAAAVVVGLLMNTPRPERRGDAGDTTAAAGGADGPKGSEQIPVHLA